MTRVSPIAWIALGAAALLLSGPETAEACSVCFSGRGEASRVAFRDTAIFLSLLPVLTIAATAWWLRRRFRQHASALEAPAAAARD